MKNTIKALPSVNQVLELESSAALLVRYQQPYVVDLVRQVLQGFRSELLNGSLVASREELLVRVERKLSALVEQDRGTSLRPVINATGVVLHTGLGRAPLAADILGPLSEAAGYCNLEFDLAHGQRGERQAHIEGLVCRHANSQAAAVVNNNAAAVLLMLSALAQGREVLISRGQLVEIGGSFRLPDIIAASGAQLREVGTTNRTHLRDYQGALGPQTGLILVVHPSNYKVMGFTAEVELAQLVELGRQEGVPVVYDLGGGVLADLRQWGLPPEPVVADCLATGVDLVSFSGDKVLGGPQAGIIAGRADLVAAVRRHPLMRVLRCDKLILAALEASLRFYDLQPELLRQSLPVLALLTEGEEVVRQRAERLLEALPVEVAGALGSRIEASRAQVGSGALPLEELPSWALVLAPQAGAVDDLARRLRLDPSAVVGRISHDELWLDMRTVTDAQLEPLKAALLRLVEAT